MAKAHKKLIIANTLKELPRAEQLDVALDMFKHIEPLSHEEDRKMARVMEEYFTAKERDVPWEAEDKLEEPEGD